MLFPILRDLPNPGIEPKSLASPILAGRGFITVPRGKHKLLLNNFSVLKVTFFHLYMEKIDRETVADFICLGSKIIADGD